MTALSEVDSVRLAGLSIPSLGEIGHLVVIDRPPACPPSLLSLGGVQCVQPRFVPSSYGGGFWDHSVSWFWFSSGSHFFAGRRSGWLGGSEEMWLLAVGLGSQDGVLLESLRSLIGWQIK